MAQRDTLYLTEAGPATPVLPSGAASTQTGSPSGVFFISGHLLMQNWFGRGDKGEVYVSMPWVFRGYSQVALGDDWLQYLVVFGLRGGDTWRGFYVIYGRNPDGPLCRYFRWLNRLRIRLRYVRGMKWIP